MPDLTFNTPAGQTVNRELYFVCLNIGTASTPEWATIGRRVEDSSAEMDWSAETKRDILGAVYTNMKKPTLTQTFDPCELDAGDPAQVYLWNRAIKDQDYAALANLDMLRVHMYAETEDGYFAERFPASAIAASSLGGAGGGAIGMPLEVTFGGTRAIGSAMRDASGVISFAED